MSQTEQFRFKILNRLSGFTLKINPVTNCWIKENNSSDLYSVVRFDKRSIGLHFLACVMFHNLDLDLPNQHPLHKCDIKACCNPDHLYVGTLSDNIKDDKFRQKNYIPDGAIHNRPKQIHNPENDLEFMPDTIQ